MTKQILINLAATGGAFWLFHKASEAGGYVRCLHDIQDNNPDITKLSADNVPVLSQLLIKASKTLGIKRIAND